MEIKVKKLHKDAVLPCQATQTDAGYDLVAIDNGEIVQDEHGKVLYAQYKTGISIEPPPGYHTEIFPRSSISKYDLMLANSIGLIDESYRGEVMVRFKPTCNTSCEYYKDYSKGDRIAQLVVRKTERVDFKWAEDLNDSNRGNGGFGSSGN